LDIENSLLGVGYSLPILPSSLEIQYWLLDIQRVFIGLPLRLLVIGYLGFTEKLPTH